MLVHEIPTHPLQTICEQHQHPPIANHPKVLPVPLGIPGDHPLTVAPWLFSRIINEKRLRTLGRTTFFHMHNSGWEFRKEINDVLKVNFPPAKFKCQECSRFADLMPNATDSPVQAQKKWLQMQLYESRCCGNVFTFCYGGYRGGRARLPRGCEKYVPYMDVLMRAKFVLCLPGMGMVSGRALHDFPTFFKRHT